MLDMYNKLCFPRLKFVRQDLVLAPKYGQSVRDPQNEFEFDPLNKLILVNVNLVKATDLHNAWKSWAINNMQYQPAMTISGGDLQVVTLLNDWRILCKETSALNNIDLHCVTEYGGPAYVKSKELEKGSKTRNIYKLEWNEEAEVPERYNTALVVKYNKIFNNLEFVLTKQYLTEIHRHCQQAFMEWGRTRVFDTNIREMCLEPAIAHMWVAFRLLCDCIYDKKERYYYKNSWIKDIAPHALAYKFWFDQKVGDSQCYYYARLDKATSSHRATDSAFANEVSEFYIDLNQRSTNRMNYIKKVTSNEE